METHLARPNPARYEKSVKEWSATTHALLIVGALLVMAVPFGWGVKREYDEFKEYVQTTIEAPAGSPAWRQAGLSPGDCVEQGLLWIEECPGMEPFCRSALPMVVSECLETRERNQYCADHSEAHKRTTFGYEECKQSFVSLDLSPNRVRRQRCALAYRAVAEYCADYTARGDG